MGEGNFENIFSNNGESKLSPEDVEAIEEAMKIGENVEVEFNEPTVEDADLFEKELTTKEKAIIENAKDLILKNDRLAGRTSEDYKNMSELLYRKYFSNSVFMKNKLDSWKRNQDVTIENAANNLYKTIAEEAIAVLEKEFPKFN